MPLHFTAWCSDIHWTVFYCPSAALHFSALCSVTHSTIFHCMMQCPALHITSSLFHFISLHGAVHFTRLHLKIMYFTAMHSLPRERATRCSLPSLHRDVWKRVAWCNIVAKDSYHGDVTAKNRLPFVQILICRLSSMISTTIWWLMKVIGIVCP